MAEGKQVNKFQNDDRSDSSDSEELFVPQIGLSQNVPQIHQSVALGNPKHLNSISMVSIPSQQQQNGNDRVVYIPLQKTKTKSSLYVIGYTILIILLTYTVFGVTYLLFTTLQNQCKCVPNESKSSVNADIFVSDGPTTHPSWSPTILPTNNPTFDPSKEPTKIPTDVLVLQKQLKELNQTTVILAHTITQLSRNMKVNITKIKNASVNIMNQINALEQTVQRLPSSMVFGWPDAITCTGAHSGHTVHYLVHGPEGNSNTYMYRFENINDQRNFVYSSDGSYNYKSGNIGPSDCDGKSITQLYDEGLAFNFVIKTIIN
eukprot:528252_1